MYDDVAPFEGSDQDKFFYSDVGETRAKESESEDHEGMMAGHSTWYVREADIEGYDAAAEIRHVWDDGIEVKTDRDILYALRNGEVDIWKAYPQDRHNENTGYGEGPNETKPVEEISDERAIELLGGA